MSDRGCSAGGDDDGERLWRSDPRAGNGQLTDAGGQLTDGAQRVRALLGAEGVTVILTRTTDTGTGPCVDRRAAMRAAGFADSNYLGSRALSPRNDLAGLNLARRPAVLVECGNMRSPAEAARMTTQPGRQRYAEAIARGVLSYLER